MSLDPLSILFPATGSFMSDEPVLFTQAGLGAGLPFVHTAVNMRIEESRWRSRHCWVELTPKDVPEDWFKLATQGAVWYNPRFGAGPVASSKGVPGIVESAEGKLFRITATSRDFSVEDISFGIVGRPSMRLAWMATGENYVIRTDGASLTQIYDGTQTTTSTGYNRNQPSLSRLPNFAGPVAYTDRFWITDRDRDIIAGDHLHRENQQDASDLLKTTDQTYDITSKSFPPPANLGNVTGLFVVTGTRGGTLPSQAEVMASTDLPAIWGILGGTPRSQWPTTPMTRVVHPDTGPVGPYAAASGRNELLMRTPEGIQSFKYFDQDSNKVGNPIVNLGQEIKPLFDRDSRDLLIFSSVVNVSGRQRFGCTVSPMVINRHRWHKAYVTATLQSSRTRVPDEFLWEGVQTLPESMGEIVQFIEGNDTGSKRVFAILRKKDGTKGLAEWTEKSGPDRLADGTLVPQEWQILTRRLTLSEYGNHAWGPLSLRVEDVRDCVTVRISARDRESKKFVEISSTQLCNASWCKGGTLGNPPIIPLGKVLGDFKGEWIQLLIEGTGSCTIDLAIGRSTVAPPADQGKKVREVDGTLCNFNIFKRAS